MTASDDRFVHVPYLIVSRRL